MVNWQVTATTIHCDAVDDEVTVMVYKDRTVKCTGYKRYCQPSRETSQLVKEKAGQLRREPKCLGLECPKAAQYRDKLFAEEGRGGQK